MIDRDGIETAFSLANTLLAGNTSQFKGAIEKNFEVTFRRIPAEPKRQFKNEILGWNQLVENGDYVAAAKSFESCIPERLTDPLSKRIASWYHYLSAHAHYLSYRYFSEEKYEKECVEHLRKAIGLGQTSWFSGLRLAISKIENASEDPKVLFDIQTTDFKESVIRSWLEFLDHVADKKHNPDRKWSELRSRVMQGTHGQVCETLKQVFGLMGLEARRLDKKQGQPDLLVISPSGRRFLTVIDVKTQEETGSVVDTDDVSAAIGYKPMYEKQYPGQEVIPVVFTNKESFSEVAISKAANSVKLIRAKEFDILLGRFYDLMSLFSESIDIYQKASLMVKIPTPASLYSLFDPSENPLTPESLDKVIKA